MFLIFNVIISLLTYSKQIAIYKLKVKKEMLKPIYNSFRLKTIFKHNNNNNNGKTEVITLQ